MAPTSGSPTLVTGVIPTIAVSAGATTAALGSTISFTATVTGPANAVTPTAIGVWAITGVAGIATCTTTTGPTGASNVATYTCSLVASKAGTYGATFTYPGDGAYSAVLPVASSQSTAVAAVSPTVTLAALPSTLTLLNGAVTFTATVTGTTNAVAPAGVMSYGITGTSGVTSCTSTTAGVSVGVVTTYTCTLLASHAGTYIVQANFATDGNYLAASSTPLTLTLAKQTPIITLAASANPAVNLPITLTTTVTGIAGAVQSTGSVSWVITDPASATVTNNCATTTFVAVSANVSTYTCIFTPLSKGIYHITSTIATDVNYAAATSATLPINLANVTPTISVVSSPLTTTTVGVPITFTATVTGVSPNPAPTGTLSWTVSGGVATSCTTTSGPVAGALTATYTCVINTPTVGTYTATATYNGDGLYSSLAPSSAITVTVTKATPTISVASSPASPLFGATITYTATVSGIVGATAPAGSVLWTINGTTSTCPTLGALGPLAGSSAEKVIFTCTIPASPAGTYSATATYSGDTNYIALAPTSPSVVVIAKVAPTTVVLTGSGGTGFGATLTYTVAVTGTPGAIAPSAGLANISWSVSGTAGLTACTSAPAGSTVGAVTTFICTITNAGYGSYIITANYLGDTSYTALSSNTITTTISQNTPTIAAITHSATTLGGTTTLSVVVAGTAGFTPAGAMDFVVTGPTGASVSCATPTIVANSPVALSTTYTCTMPTATAGNYLATANFPGDSNYNAVSSATATIAVAKTTPLLSVSAVQSSSAGGQIITFTANVLGTAGSLPPTGTPTWTLTGPAGPIASCTTTTGPVTSVVTSIYTCAIPAASSGTYSGAITYNGDSNYTTAGPSAATSLAITKLIPTVTVTTSAATVALGATFTFTATVTGPTTGLTPSGAGTWSIAGVSGISCTSTTGPTGSTYSVTYSCPVFASTAGTYLPVFTYAGDSNYYNVAPTSGTSTVVTGVTPTVVVATTFPTATLGSTIAFTATVTGPANAVTPVATGIWAITGVAGIATCTTTTGPTGASNVATYSCHVVASRAGSYGATFTYPGDSAYSAVLPVASATTTLVVAPAPSIVISSTPAPALGGSVTITATVTGNAGAIAPAGVVNWSVSGTGGLVSCPATVGPNTTGVTSIYTCTIPTAQAGTYIISAAFAGDANYASASSNVLTLTLAKQTPLVTASTSPNPTLGGTTTVTTTVIGVVGATQPTGAVSVAVTNPNSQLLSCINPIGPIVNSNVSTYTCTFLTALAGNYAITSTIATDTNYTAAVSPTMTMSLGTSTPTIVLNATPATTVGQTMIFSAVVSGSTALAAPTGNLTWNISGSAAACTSNTGPVYGAHTATYTCSIFAVNSGTYTATATYGGDTIFTALAPTAPASIVVTAATPTIAVSVPVVNPVLGGTITFTATVTGMTGAAAPGGTMAWTLNGLSTLCNSHTGPTVGTLPHQAIFTCTVNAAQAGNYVATAAYSGDSNYTALAPASSTVVVIAKVAPPIVLTVSGGGGLGANIVFTATITGTTGSAAATGSVTWSLNGPVGINACAATPASTSVGVVTTYVCSIIASSYGTYALTAHFPGDVNYLAGASNTASMNISTLVATVTISASSPQTLGGTTTLTALVAAQTTPNPLPAGTMSWTVTDESGASVTCTTVTSTLNTSGYALPTTAYACTFPTVTAGTYSATANFPGDSNYNAKDSSPLAIVVPKATPTLAVTDALSVTIAGQFTVFTGTITGAVGSVPPTGAPTWTVTGASTSCSGGTSGPVTSGVSSIYTCTVPANVSGGYAAAITYAGDSNYNPVGPSPADSINIAKSTPIVVVTTSSPTAALGSNFTFTATVTGKTGGQTPTGTGTWSITGVSGVNCLTSTGPTGAGIISTYICTVKATIAGTYLPLFTYNGDSNYLATSPTSGSSTIVSPATPTISVVANQATAALGTAFAFTATVTGPTGAVAPSSTTSSWTVTGVTGITTCTSVTGPSQGPNTATYTCTVTGSVAGTYGAKFTFTGDSSYNPVAATTSSTTTVVAKATPTVNLVANPTTTRLGGSETITATVTGATNAVAPTGAISWIVNGTAGITACSSNGGPTSSGNTTSYTCSFQTPNVGAYVIQASVATDINYLAATSTQLPLSVSKQTPSISVSASANPTLGGTTTITTTVSGLAAAVAPGGAVTTVVTDPTTAIVPCVNQYPGSISANVVTYSCSFQTLTPGTYYVNSTVAADSNYATATSSTIAVSLGSATPTIFINPPAGTPTTGQDLIFQAIVTGVSGLPAPTGGIVWTVTGQASVCTATANPLSPTRNTAVYACTIAAPVAGTYTVSATYNGDLNYAAATTSPPTSIVVMPATPTLALTLSPSLPSIGNVITYTATVTGAVGAVAPGGIITWAVTGAKSACAPSTGPNPGLTTIQTVFTCVLAADVAGTYSVSATYSGDTNFTALPTVAAADVIIAKATPVLVLSGVGDGVRGGSAVFTLSLTTPAGAKAPTGAISWAVSGTGGATSCASQSMGAPSGVLYTYVCSVTEINDGTFVVVATYPGDTNYQSVISNTFTLSVRSLIPRVAVTVQNSPPPVLGASTQLTVLIDGPSGSPVPVGTVTWTVTNALGNNVVCSSVPTGIDTSTYPLPTTAYSCLLPLQTAGTYIAVANFGGDINYDAAVSAPLPIAVAQVAPTLTLTGATSSNSFGAPITFTATIAGVANSLPPTGTIIWTRSGLTNRCSANTGPAFVGESAIYTCVVTVAGAGTYGESFSYSGDSNYLSGASAVVPITVGPQIPTITFTTTPGAPVLGDTLTITATINPFPGGPTPGGTIRWTLSGTSGATTCDSSSGAGLPVQSCIVIARTAGTYVATAAYGGDTDYIPVTLSAPVITIAKALPLVTIVNSGSPTAGGSVTFNVIVNGVANANIPTGTITVDITGTGSTSPCVPTASVLVIANALTYSCVEQLPTVGTYVATASYPGDSNYLPNLTAAPDVVTITSAVLNFLPTTLGAITNLQLLALAVNAVVPVQVTWDRLALAGSYVVLYGTNLNSLSPASCADTTLNSCMVQGLVNGNTYYFSVNGYQLNAQGVAIGQGIPANASITIPVYTPPLPSPPASGGLPTFAAPLPLAAPVLTGVGADKKVTLSWTGVTDVNRSGYLLEYSLDGQVWIKGPVVTTTDTTATVTGLSNGVSTIFRLTPQGAAGSGVASHISVTPGVVAQAPTALTAQSGDSQVDLSWTAPTDTGGLKITNYIVEQSTDGTTWTLATTTAGDTTQVNLQGLKNYTIYTFRVSAITNFGRGLAATLATNSSALPSAPLSLHIVSTDSQTVVIGWSLPAGATLGSITGFEVDQSLDGIAWTTVTTTGNSATTATLTGLINGTTYEIRLTPIAGAGSGASSVIVAAPGAAPSAVSKLAAAPGDKKVILTFTTPSNNGGFSIDYYTVEIANSANGPWNVAIANTGSSLTTVSVPRLKNATTYFFKIVAVNQIGTGPDSLVVSATPQPSAPAPVIQSFVMTNTTAKITWIPAVGSKPNSILKFLVETSPEGLKWTTVATLAPTVKTYTLKRLKTPQLVRVRAVNNIGPGIPTLGVRIPGTVATVGAATGAGLIQINPKPSPTPVPVISGAPKTGAKK